MGFMIVNLECNELAFTGDRGRLARLRGMPLIVSGVNTLLEAGETTAVPVTTGLTAL